MLRWRRPTIATAFALITIGVFLSYSRAAWLNWVVGIVVLMAVLPLRRGGTGRALVMILVVLSGVGATAATVVLTGQTDFVQERAHFQTYDNERFGAQELGLELAESKPIGIGPGQFERASPVSAHSTYIRSGAEQGVLGFFVIGDPALRHARGGGAQRDPRGGTRPASARSACWPCGPACSPTASSSTRCTGVTCSSSPA